MLIGQLENLKKIKISKKLKKLLILFLKLRSFKNELNVSPGSFIDISIIKLKKSNHFLLKMMINFKKLGRINNFLIKI